MKRASIVAGLILTITVMGMLWAPAHPGLSSGSGGSVPARASVPGVPSLVPNLVAPAAPTPQTAYPRTVLLEVFTGEWCHYCPGESQAVYSIEQNYSRTNVITAEIHVCGGTPPNCYDNYMPADNTSYDRSLYYNIQGVPTAVFDGSRQYVGNPYATTPPLTSAYENLINSSMAYSGNVSIVQSAFLPSPSTVTSHAIVTSGITGSYVAITYLVEYIGKNISSDAGGTHDIGYVVRETLADQTVDLTAGTEAEVNGTGSVGAAWPVANLSVITFIQQSSTGIIENANTVPVATMAASVQAASSVDSTANLTLTVKVSNSVTGEALPGATVQLSSNGGGTFAPSSGTTASNGSFVSKFTAPEVLSAETIVITTQVTEPSYPTVLTFFSVLVNPLVAPSAPTTPSLSPGNGQVVVNWLAPASGGGGVTYHVYRSTTQTGGYSQVDVTTAKSYTDTTLTSGTSYWYKVDAQNVAGFSPNSTSIIATSVVATPDGLPAHVGWWLTIDSIQVNSTNNGAISLHLPVGSYSYTFGPGAYTYVAPYPTGSVVVGSDPVTFTTSFWPNVATLEGSVTPASATVVLNNSVLQVVDGQFTDSLVAGNYTLKVTSPGYVSNSTLVVLTPGNTTTMNVALVPNPSSGSQPSSSVGLTGPELAAIIAVVGVIGVAAVFGMTRSRNRRTSPPTKPAARPPTAPPGSPPGKS